MAHITAQRTGEFQCRILDILKRHPEGFPAKSVLAQLAEELPPKDFERSEYASRPGVRRFEYIARFASIPLVKAGWPGVFDET
jgi:hypothetical protein